QSFKQALQKKMAPGAKAKTLKLLGISQYMRGNKGGAANTFKAALKANPKTVISQNEVLDESVIGFFNGVKGKQGSKGAGPKKQIAQKPKKAQGPPASKTGANKKKTSTFIRITSNVQGSVFIDGILAGQTGSQ